MDFKEYLQNDTDNRIIEELNSLIEDDKEVLEFKEQNELSEVLDFVFDKYFNEINELKKKNLLDDDHLGLLMSKLF